MGKDTTRCPRPLNGPPSKCSRPKSRTTTAPTFVSCADADPTYLDVSVPPGKRKTLPVETPRHGCAYVFAGSGTFYNASEPLAVPTEGVGWWPHATPDRSDSNGAGIVWRW
jgi:hypothetical protein